MSELIVDVKQPKLVDISTSSKTYQEKKDEERRLLEIDYQEQLKAFAEDTSYYADYDCFDPFTKKVLVKIFKFVPKETTSLLGTQQLYTVSKLDGQLTTTLQAANQQLFPIVKVIKVGKGVSDIYILANKLYTVPVDDVIGDDWNPEFTHYMNTMVTQGKQGGHVKLPEGMRQRIPKLERNWDKYKFGVPNRLGSEKEEDRLIYLIPDMKLEAIFTP